MEHKIKHFLDEIGMTQKMLAEKTGFSETGISKMITSGKATKLSLQKIADTLNVPIEYLIVNIPSQKALYEGILKIGEKELPCAVLNDGTRIITQSAVFKALERPARGNSRMTDMPTFMDAKNLQQYVNEEVIPMTKKVEYYDLKGNIQTGYNCLILPIVCDIYLKARENGELHPTQLEAAHNAEILVRTLAKVGIIALVDEATGYDKEKLRAKDELQKILNSFLCEEAAKWVKQFDDQFFEDIYKMRNWTWKKAYKKPGVVGTWIKEIVYDRLAPILPELERRNPKNIHGNRSYKHHQFLSKDIGLPKLKQHLEAIHAIAVISNYKWDVFMRNLNKAYPSNYTQLYLDFDFDDD